MVEPDEWLEGFIHPFWFVIPKQSIWKENNNIHHCCSFLVFQLAYSITGVIGAPLLGIFFLGILIPRANYKVSKTSLYTHLIVFLCYPRKLSALWTAKSLKQEDEYRSALHLKQILYYIRIVNLYLKMASLPFEAGTSWNLAHFWLIFVYYVYLMIVLSFMYTWYQTCPLHVPSYSFVLLV